MDLCPKKSLDNEKKNKMPPQKRRISSSPGEYVLGFWSKYGIQKKNHY